MRLGKEQAAGYVEDAEADALQVEQLASAQSEEVPSITGADDASLNVS